MTVTADLPDYICAEAGADCDTTFAVKNHVGLLVVSNDTAGYPVNLYEPPYDGAAIPVGGSHHYSMGLAFNSKGDLAITNFNQLVRVHAPPYDVEGTAVYDPGGPQATGASFDASDNLAISVYQNYTMLLAYPYTASPYAGVFGSNGYGPPGVFDGAGNVWIAEATGLSGHAPPTFAGPPLATFNITYLARNLRGGPGGKIFYTTAFNALYVAEPPYDSPQLVTGSCRHLAVDARGNVYAATDNQIQVFDASYQLVHVIDGVAPAFEPYLQGGKLAVGPGGDIFTANGNNTITVHVAPYDQPPIVITDGVLNPISLAVQQ